MKRNAVALLLAPYKNVLLAKNDLRDSLKRFCEQVLALADEFKNIVINIALPAYMLEYFDPMLLANLRTLQKQNRLEWLSTGFTEPFFSFSPRWLLAENIACGSETFAQIATFKPSGFMIPFSNWEPAHIDILRKQGLHFSIISKNLLPAEARRFCGYWTTEYGGASFVMSPAHYFQYYTAPADIIGWCDSVFNEDPRPAACVKTETIAYLIPLVHEQTIDPYIWIRESVKAFDKMTLKYQLVGCEELLNLNLPIGLQYLPPSLVLSRDQGDADPYFLNYLHTFDQVGLLQRRMLEIAEMALPRRGTKQFEAIKKDLFFVQDINRFLPGRSGGFGHLADRLWCYGKMIDVEQVFHDTEKVEGGQVKIVDFLKTGGKNIVMANSQLKLYIDHKNGGHIFELDFIPRRLNMCAGYSVNRYAIPDVVAAEVSPTAFIDRLLPIETTPADYAGRHIHELGDFVQGSYDYKIKKTASAVKAVLTRRGTLMQSDKPCPLTIEKVFGLEKSGTTLSFVHQLTNNSLIPYEFRFGLELTLTFPCALDQPLILTEGKLHHTLGADPVVFDKINEWRVDDPHVGVRVTFFTQKPVQLWCFPTTGSGGENGYQGTTFVLSSCVKLAENSSWTLMGKLVFASTRPHGKATDAI